MPIVRIVVVWRPDRLVSVSLMLVVPLVGPTGVMPATMALVQAKVDPTVALVAV